MEGLDRILPLETEWKYARAEQKVENSALAAPLGL